MQRYEKSWYETLNMCEEKKEKKKTRIFLLTGKKKFSVNEDMRYGSI